MDRIDLLSTSLMVTEYCSLRCKLCLAYIPYIENKQVLLLDDAKKVLRNFFAMIDTVKKFSITGGEPLLNKDLSNIIKEIIKFDSQIKKEIILITNGTIKIPDGLVDILSSSNKFKCIVNNYGDISKYAVYNYEKLRQRNINTIIYNEDNSYGWVDCRDHSLKHYNEDDIIRQACQCVFFNGKKYVINRGKLFTCTRAEYRFKTGIIKNDSSCYIDLLMDNLIYNRKNIEKLLNLKFTKSCAYCSGRTEKSILYKAAEQL